MIVFVPVEALKGMLEILNFEENFDALHPDGEKSQILHTMHQTLSKPCEEELAFLILADRAT